MNPTQPIQPLVTRREINVVEPVSPAFERVKLMLSSRSTSANGSSSAFAPGWLISASAVRVPVLAETPTLAIMRGGPERIFATVSIRPRTGC